MATMQTTAINSTEVPSRPPFFPCYLTQLQSPLFQLPAELRLHIFSYVLAPEDDPTNVYPFSSYYYRPPKYMAGKKHNMAMLQTCKRVFMEAIDIVYKDVLGEESFYWGWEERRPKEFRHHIGKKPEEDHCRHCSDEEDEDSEGYSDEEMEDEEGLSEEEEEEEEEDYMMDEADSDRIREPMVHPTLTLPLYPNLDSQPADHLTLASQQLSHPDPYPSHLNPSNSPEPGYNTSSTHHTSSEASVWDDDMSDLDTHSLADSTPALPYKAHPTDHPFQHHRHRSYLPHQWARIHTITIFPQLFAFSVPTFNMFFSSQPLLQPKTVQVTVRYTDWWSWEDNLRHDIEIGMNPGFSGRVILPDSVSTFILELETCDLKTHELRSVVSGIRQNPEGWRWARTDGYWLELTEEDDGEREWVGPTVYYDESVKDEENIYGTYRFAHHPKGPEMRYVVRRLVWRVGRKEEGVEEGEIVPLGEELNEWGMEVE